MLNLAIAIFLLPLVAFIILAFLHKRLPRHGDFVATGAMGLGFIASLIIFFNAFGDEKLFINWTFDWLPVSTTKVIKGGILIDGLTAVMLVVVTLVSFLVHLFSSKYMENDVRYGRYYACLALFSMSMLGLVLADNLMFLFIFWELVGLSSYTLIGHWFEKKSASNAAIKAFITTRVGDVGMLLGLLICYWKVGSLQYVDLFAAVGEANLFNVGSDIDWQTLAGLGLFVGAMGKSAQWPLHVWLPDAMEGPTPVSALIHAATMVAAGVYLVGRLYPLFTPEAFLFVAYIGAITALFAATIATVQDDIKKVLAYSTLSQLGYMMLALGVGGYAAGLFHLTTHAFFKAGLFLGSGSVIYAMHHEQLMSKYGGLAKKMPITNATYLICVMAIAGVPLLSGFFSKDAILAAALQFGMDHPSHWFLAFSGFFTAFLTAYYMFRQYFLTFTGKTRNPHAYDHAHESPWQMTAPLIILAFLAVVAGWGRESGFANLLPSADRAEIIQTYRDYHQAAGTPLDIAPLDAHGTEVAHADAAHGAADAHGDEHAAGEHGGAHGHGSAHGIAMALSILLAGLGITVAWLAFKENAQGRTVINPAVVARRIRPVHTLLWNKYYFDELYGLLFVGSTLVTMKIMAALDRFFVDGIVNLVGKVGLWLSFVTDVIFDRWIVDGLFVNGSAWLASFTGNTLSLAQTGRTRNYLLFIVLGVVGLSVILMIAV